MSIKRVVVIYVEGDSEFIFYKKLIRYIREKNGKPNSKIEYINIKGIGKFASKVPAKYKNEILLKYASFEHNIFLAYDTDVFELSQKPPINWDTIEEKLRLEGAQNIYHLKARKMIEDWFIIDLEGICRNLKIDVPRKLKGNTGYDKIKKLFKSANRIYQKGYNSNNFINSLNISVIYPRIKKVVDPLEKALY